MLVSLDEFKDYVGITSVTEDDFLTGHIAVVSEAIEAYCRRKFLSASYVQTFYQDDFAKETNSIALFHYPVSAIASATLDLQPIDSSDYRLNLKAGVVVFPKGIYWSQSSTSSDPAKLIVTYTAGFSVIPATIKHVVCSLTQEAYNKKKAGIGLSFGSDVQRVSIPGTLSIDFDYSLSTNDRSSAFGTILGNFANVLDYHRSERIVGSGKLTYVV